MTATARVRVEEEVVRRAVSSGSSNCRAFVPGYTFTLSDHPDATVNADYALTRVEHVIDATSGESQDATFEYLNRFRCIAKAMPYHPPRLTPRPRVLGDQTAVVVGTSGQEIYTDAKGRVKVQFHWDRLGKSDENSSCWIRVSQAWAGKTWGSIHIPRIGQEVVVSFLEGDPDRPLITGRVYNGSIPVPYTLPDNATQSGIKSRSSLKGESENFNELRFEDKKGSEQIFFHAEKDFLREVENNDTLVVGVDGSSSLVDGNQTITVYKDRTETVKTGNETVTIEKGNRTVTVKEGNDKHEVSKGKRDIIVESDDTTVINTGNRSVTVKTGNDTHEVKTGNRTVTVDTGNDSHTVKTGNRTVEVSMGNDSLTVKMGNQTTKVSLGASSTEAMQSITLKVGGNSITIDQSGITLKGMMIKLQGSIEVQVQGTMVQINGDGMLKMQGAITMIN